MLWLLGLAALGLLAAGLLLWLFQGRLLFFPMAGQVLTPSALGLGYRDLAIDTADGERLSAWLVPAPADAPRRDLTLLFLHGNAGNISHRGDSLRIFADLGLDVLILDYRGYGRSTGSPSEQGLYRDARTAWDWLVQQHGVPPERIVIFGRSLGGAVAARLAGGIGMSDQAQPAALIVESSFADGAALARHHYPLLTAVIPLRFRFPAAEWIGRARCPVLILHSPDDEIVPESLGRALFAAAPEPKHFFALRGGHNNGFLASQPAYQHAIAHFLDAHATARP